MTCPIYFTWSWKKDLLCDKRLLFLCALVYSDFTKKRTERTAWNLSCTHRPLCSLFTSQLSAKPIPEQAVWQIHFPPLRIWSPSSSWASDTGSVRQPIGGPVPLLSSSNASSARSRVDSKSLRQNGNQEFCIKSNLPRERKIYILELTKNGCPKRSVVTKGSCTFPITERSLHKTYSRLFFSFSTSFGHKFFE